MSVLTLSVPHAAFGYRRIVTDFAHRCGGEIRNIPVHGGVLRRHRGLRVLYRCRSPGGCRRTDIDCSLCREWQLSSKKARSAVTRRKAFPEARASSAQRTLTQTTCSSRCVALRNRHPAVDGASLVVLR